MSLTAIMFKTMAGMADKKRDSGLKTPNTIKRYDNICYGTDPKSQSLDVYRPKVAADKKLPVIINVHGGGWVYGDKELYQYYCMSLSKKGFAVINFTYRLAPRNKFPAQIEDVNSVVNWMFENQNKYNFDLKHVFFVGDSAGAHLTSLYSCICTNNEFAQKYHKNINVPKNFVPTAVGLNCGVYLLEQASDKKDMMASLMGDLLGKNPQSRYIEISPVLYINERFPPAFVMSAKGDFLVTQVPVISEKLESCGVKYTVKIHGTDEKPLHHVFHCDVKMPEAIACNNEECDFFKSFLTEKQTVQ